MNFAFLCQYFDHRWVHDEENSVDWVCTRCGQEKEGNWN